MWQRIPRWLRLEHRGQRVGDRLTRMKPLASQHLEEHHAERPDIGAMIDRFPTRLFGTHVRRCPQDHAHVGHRGSGDRRRQRWVARAGCHFQRLRQTEVEHLHSAVRPQRDVRGLQVTMDDASFVRGLESVGDLVSDRDGLTERHRPLRDAIGERLSLDELENEGVNVCRILDAVDRRDVRVVERREDLRFALEARDALAIEREARRAGLSARRRVRASCRARETPRPYHPTRAVRGLRTAQAERRRRGSFCVL